MAVVATLFKQRGNFGDDLAGRPGEDLFHRVERAAGRDYVVNDRDALAVKLFHVGAVHDEVLLLSSRDRLDVGDQGIVHVHLDRLADDDVVDVVLTNGHNELVLANRNGRAIRFSEEHIRCMGRTATGVRGMTLDGDDDAVVGMVCIYNLEKDKLVQDINFRNDLATSDLVVRGTVDKYRPPVFKVNTQFTWFANGEVKAELLECVRGKDIYIFQDAENHSPIPMNGGKNTVTFSVNDHVMTLLVTIDAVQQAGAASITLVLPSFPYSRQHKKKSREGLTAALLCHIYELKHVTRVITLDIHSREIVNAFNTTYLDNLHASYQIIRELAKVVNLTGPNKEDLVVVSPDTGAIDRNKFYATGLKVPLAMIYKERDYSIVTQDAHSTNIKSVKAMINGTPKRVYVCTQCLKSGKVERA